MSAQTTRCRVSAGIVGSRHSTDSSRLYSLSIAPWNAPIGLTIRAVALPIVCGNTVVLKCSEVSPRTQALVVEILEKVGYTHYFYAMACSLDHASTRPVYRKGS